ncbi:SRPBCC family protein [Plantibacter sp. YIM 135347]|uniref:SRPBCC family protein n=1 Tax=Plantibacter sp. YIM 135347 TaxID=3423919 RepID=UPI003D324E72
MSTNTRVMHCTPAAVFAVLADGWLFPGWVVGASRMREVEATWPAEGSRLHHSFGVWPILLDDVTSSLEWDPPNRCVIQPHGWPIGEARVTIQVRARGTDSIVQITEEAVKGPGSWIPKFLLDVPLWLRNTETLRRLEYLARGRENQRAANQVPEMPTSRA